MSKNTNKLVPKLRFPEFRDAGKWEEKKLDETCQKISQGGTPDTSNLEYWNGDIEWLTPAEMGKLDTRFIASTNRKITKLGLKNCSSDLLPINSVILSTRAPIGHLLINKSEMAINQGCKGLIPLPSTSFDYLYYGLARFKKELSDLGAGNTFKELSGSALKNFKLPFPDFSEQQKIADCLSSIDELISAQSQKVEALKIHKKSLMQQLFPIEGETVPRLRFPEFRDAGEWKEQILGQCLLRHPEYGINAPAVPYSENLPTYLRITDISEDGQIRQNEKVSVAKSITDENYLEDGDIVLARTGASVGKSYKYRVKDGRLVFAGFLIRIRPNQEKLKSEFLFQFLATEHYWRWVVFISARSGQPGINGNEYASLPIPLPPKEEEQQKIADCLSSIDDIITAQNQKLETLKIHKKGLMQQLFPTMNEVNAEVVA